MGITIQYDDGFRHHSDLPLKAIPAVGIKQVHVRHGHHTDIRLNQYQFGAFRPSGLVDISAKAEYFDLGAQHPELWIPPVEWVIAPVGQTGPHCRQIIGRERRWVDEKG